MRRFRPVDATESVYSSRGGSILTWFAVFLFALLPLMTLVVHLGMVTLTRRQMQTAVNTAAIEGLRFQDDASLTETHRRQRVRDLTSAVYDDNLNSDSADALSAGAGPTIAFDNEASDISLPGTTFKASRTIKSSNIGVYDPELELNSADARDGDMVRGQFVATADHEEALDYQREDLRLPGDSGYDATIGNDAFLVRLRRSGETFSGNAGSAGPTIPFLFVRGPYGGSEFLDRRERGTIVRATTIARARPVVTVGVPSPADDLDEGLALFDMQQSSWSTLTSASVSFASNGSFASGVTGRLILRDVLTLGDETTPFGSTLPDVELELGEDRIVPIVEPINGRDRIVGFGLVRLSGGGGTYTLEKMPEAIIPLNCASMFTKPLTVTGSDFDEVWQAFNTLNSVPDSNRVLAPAHVRSIN